MKMVTLSLRYPDETEQLAELSWADGCTRIVAAVDTLRPELERFINEGLSEWFGPPDDPQPRTTLSSDPRFLDRLSDYLRRQFNYIVELQQYESQARKRDTA